MAGIYAGTITQWDAAPIAALNPGVKLPHQPIVPIRRADASGDTFIFTQFLDFSTQSWEDKIGYGTSVAWPAVPGERTATGNDGMVQTAAATPYSIAYIGISFRDAIAKAGLGTAMLKNQNGKFVLPTAETISAGASVLDPRTPPDERLSLVFATGDNSYPLINYEYAVVSTRQPDPATAAALRHFLLWAIAPDGRQHAEIPRCGGLHPAARFHPRAEREPDQSDQVTITRRHSDDCHTCARGHWEPPRFVRWARENVDRRQPPPSNGGTVRVSLRRSGMKQGRHHWRRGCRGRVHHS